MRSTSPPPSPQVVSGLAPEDQSRVLLEEYTDALAWGADEAQMRQVLIDYIKRVKEWYERSH